MEISPLTILIVGTGFGFNDSSPASIGKAAANHATGISRCHFRGVGGGA